MASLRRPRRPRSRFLTAAALVLGASLALSACSSSGGGGESTGAAKVSKKASTSRYQGTVLSKNFEKPDLVLDDTSGQPYDLRARTAGKTVLLFFGYTSCPDVCPTTMGDIGVAMSKLTAEQREKLAIVFVSTDPERDTPQVLRTWLDSMGKDFVGMTGDLAKVRAAARPLGIAVEDPVVDAKGAVTSTHGAQVLAFLPTDDKAHLLYMAGTSTDVYKHDLALLADGVAV